MGGEKFDTPHPEGYLFGENMDLNFLGNRPVQVGPGGAGHEGSGARPLPLAAQSWLPGQVGTKSCHRTGKSWLDMCT